MYNNLFVNAHQSANYASYRPQYPKDLFSRLLSFAGIEEGAKRSCLVDVATGSGQALVGLASSFQRAIGLDASSSQVANAVQLPNVEYLVGEAHDLPLEAHSTDMVVVSQALHWFDIPK